LTIQLPETSPSGESNPGKEVSPGYCLERPAEIRVPFVFNSPHSGNAYSQEFIQSSRLDAMTLRKSEDCFVDELFAGVVPIGAPLLKAEFPRAWLDVNREPWELDPEMFDGPLPANINSRSARVTGGLGTIARIVSETEEIYADKIPSSQAISRIQNHYIPYHAALRNLLATTVVNFGHAVLIDCHSMPSCSQSANPLRREHMRADFVLGDRFGTSCAPQITHFAASFLRELGYHVVINKPYAGGFITEHYGRPENGLHALQIEINRALYMDEKHLTKNTGFHALAADLSSFVSRLVSIPETGLAATIPLAAE
jgi:N-formylglutamate amidohydrolase